MKLIALGREFQKVQEDFFKPLEGELEDETGLIDSRDVVFLNQRFFPVFPVV